MNSSDSFLARKVKVLCFIPAVSVAVDEVISPRWVILHHWMTNVANLYQKSYDYYKLAVLVGGSENNLKKSYQCFSFKKWEGKNVAFDCLIEY